MKKKLIALAVASMFAAPAVALAAAHTGGGAKAPAPAAASSVTIFGTISSDFANTSATGQSAAATPGQSAFAGAYSATGAGNIPGRNTINNNSTNIGFRGSEDLGGGLSAVFQCESGISIDAGGSTLCGRNSKVGLVSKTMGEINYGNWDSPYKLLNISRLDPFYGSSQGAQNALIGSPGHNVITATSGAAVGAASFDLRLSNSLNYVSPKMGNFTVRATYVANEGKSVVTPVTVDPNAWSVSGIYDAGTWSLGYAYERHNDMYGVNVIRAAAFVPVAGNSSRDIGHKLGGDVKFGNTTLSATWERLDYDSSVAASAGTATVKSYERRAYALGVMHKVGAGTIRAGYQNANSGSCTRYDGVACVTGNLGAKLWSVGYSHSLSKRTDLYGFYTQLTNDSDARYRMSGAAGSVAALGNVGSGADPKALALGIRHSF